MALQSQLFRGDTKLEAAAVSDPAHITPGAKGAHVGKIQQALIQVDGAAISQDSAYGPATAAAVSAFKTKRKILNFEGKIDNIVGKKTMAALDTEMLAKEKGAGGSRVQRGIVGDSSAPGVLGTPLDIFVQFTGGLGGAEGTRETLDEANFRVKTNTPGYLAGHLPVLPIIFVGGRGGTDRSTQAAAEVLGFRAITPNGVTVVVGNSSGGLMALKTAFLLTGLGIKLDYVGIADGAFFDRDGEIDTVNPLRIRVPGPIVADRKESYFQTFGHEILTNPNGTRGFITGTEFHGPIDGFLPINLETRSGAVAQFRKDFNAPSSPVVPLSIPNASLPGFLKKRLFSDPAHKTAGREADRLIDLEVAKLIKP